jgi:glucose/arabinose dehydrogenase/mono/diheme cytochrome c family protein
MLRSVVSRCLFAVGLLCLVGFTTFLKTPSEEEPSPPKSPEQERTTFQLEPGLRIELVAAEPLVQDPVTMLFDPDGRLWVVEMRGFMPTLDGDGERERSGRVSVLEDRDGDGRMEHSTIFLDSLILPRALALVPGGALVAEKEALWFAEDKNGDLRAETKTLIDKDYAGSPLPEHAGNGLWRSVDNWYYNAKSRFRYRLVGKTWKRDSTEFRGQWGLSHDDRGRLVYNYNWSQLHGDLVPPNTFSRNKNHTPTTGIDAGLTLDRRIYPIRPTPAVNRGYIPGTLDKDGKLLEFTAACSPLVYRGVTLPAEFRGNAFVCEPAGNLVKRNAVETTGLTVAARDPHPGREFLASTDERFRPVALATGPDGALYVADMYRGLIQHGAYVTPYLKEQTRSRKLDQPVHLGRIWRILPENYKPTQPRKLSTASPDELVATLSHADGWHRDVAQRLLVERGGTVTVPALTKAAREGQNPLGRFHALWTLEGLNALQPDLLLPLVNDRDPLVSSTALRLLEPLAKASANTRSLLEKQLSGFGENAPAEVQLQFALTANALGTPAALPLLSGILDRHGDQALLRDAVMSSLGNREFAFLNHLWKAPTWQAADANREIFLETLTTALARRHDPAELKAVLALLEKDPVGNPTGWRQKSLLAGLTNGSGKGKPVALPAAPKLLARLSSLDATQADAFGSLFTWPGKPAKLAAAVKKNPLTPDEQKLFALGRQHYLTTCAGCHGTDGGGMRRFAPPLNGSEWVTGDEKRLALILLHGMEGPLAVAGKHYDAPDILPVMPAHSTLDDAVLTAILTYIRNAWGNNAGAVSRRTVGMTRITSQGRVVPWTAAELERQSAESKVPTGK